MPREELISQEKFEELTKEHEELRTTRRKEVAEQLEYARSLGDLSENAEYQEAREMQAAVEERIQKLESILKNAKIVRSSKSDTIGMGSTVSVQKVGNDPDASAGAGKHTYTIVGAEEADVLSGKVSYHSPLGAALLGKKKGDEFSFHTPKGTQKYKILKVE
jgi:transcription elongation factor GreA